MDFKTEFSCLVNSLELEKEELSKFFEEELNNTKEENAAELSSMQRIIKQCQEDLQLKESSHGAVAGFLRSEIARLESEAEGLKSQIERLTAECASLKHEADVEKKQQLLIVSSEQLQTSLDAKQKVKIDNLYAARQET